MIYKFKSQAAADVIMLAPNGNQILSIIGKEPAPQGIVTASQIPVALAALKLAIEVQEVSESKRREDSGQMANVEGDSIMLRHRAGPFIDLLKASAQADKDVVWGV